MTVMQGSALKVAPDVVCTDLDTDWVPDPWGWLDIPSRPVDVSELLDRSATEPLHRLLVPFVGGRRREVPLLGFATRALLTGSAASLVHHHQRQLAEGVFGYLVDDAGRFIHYREELARRRDRERELEKRSPVLATADLRRFFRSVTTDHLMPSDGVAHVAGSVELGTVLERFQRELGYVLPEGYAAARGLANLALVTVDSSIRVPFTRWLDDYRLYCAGEDQAQAELAALRGAAVAAGFDLAETKTKIGPAAAQVPGADASLGDHSEDERSPGDVLRSLRNDGAAPGEMDRKGRFALRAATESRDDDALSVLREGPPSAVPSAWLPRLAWLISACPSSPASAALLTSLWHIEDEFSPWRRLRLAPCLWYLPAHITAALDLVRVYDELPPARPALTRGLARHCPGQLRQLSTPSGADEQRARGLGDIEAGMRTAATPLEATAVRTAPPIASFL